MSARAHSFIHSFMHSFMHARARRRRPSFASLRPRRRRTVFPVMLSGSSTPPTDFVAGAMRSTSTRSMSGRSARRVAIRRRRVVECGARARRGESNRIESTDGCSMHARRRAHRATRWFARDRSDATRAGVGLARDDRGAASTARATTGTSRVASSSLGTSSSGRDGCDLGDDGTRAR